MSPTFVGYDYIRDLYVITYLGDVFEGTVPAEMAPALLLGSMSILEEI